MSARVPGIHHVTAIAGDPQANVDFYAGVLGLALVKRTINFDDPNSYHLYYGIGPGHPGTLMTFFPWPGARRGRRGSGEVTAAAFSVPPASLPWWEERLRARGVPVDGPSARWDGEVLAFDDPDGLAVELVAEPGGDPREPAAGTVTSEHAIRGLAAVTMTVAVHERSVELLETLGFRMSAEDGNRFRFETGSGAPGARLDLVRAPDAPPGRIAVGSVHHVAWRAPGDHDQIAWRERLAAQGHGVTPIVDRRYFRSIYVREPGGVLFEIATDAPGFAIDEPVESLGRSLMLPDWLEPQRARIERALPPLVVPA